VAAVVRERIEGPVLVVTLDDPDHLNAYDGATLKAVAAAWERLDGDPALRAGVLTGEGRRAFCAGADVAAVAGGGFDDPPYPELAENLAAKPVVAAIEGLCLGGGMMVACGCDLRVAGRSAAFGLPEARWNLPAQWLGALSRQLLPAHALELALVADERLPAERLREMGWLTTVCDDGEALPTAIALAGRIAAMAPRAVRHFKELVRRGTWSAPDATLERGLAQSIELMGMADTVEGAAAFAERRAPEYRDA
jgi:enoyl-CoA hydratase/carnithine racemase